MLDTFVNPVIESVNSLFPEIMQSHSWLFYLKEQSFDLNLWTDKIFHMIFFLILTSLWKFNKKRIPMKLVPEN